MICRDLRRKELIRYRSPIFCRGETLQTVADTELCPFCGASELIFEKQLFQTPFGTWVKPDTSPDTFVYHRPPPGALVECFMCNALFHVDLPILQRSHKVMTVHIGENIITDDIILRITRELSKNENNVICTPVARPEYIQNALRSSFKHRLNVTLYLDSKKKYFKLPQVNICDGYRYVLVLHGSPELKNILPLMEPTGDLNEEILEVLSDSSKNRKSAIFTIRTK
jgi:hypothetical protein